MATPEPAPRYSFPPLEKRGVLLGLTATQLVTMGGGALAALLAHAALGGFVGMMAAVAVLGVAGLGSLWSRSGRLLVEWVPVSAGWLARRSRGPLRCDAPLEGVRAGARPERPRGAARMTSPPGIELVRDLGAPGQPDLGLVHDRTAHRWAAAIPVRGRSFSLLDAAEQAQMLEAWRSVLGAVGRSGSKVSRLQWLVRTRPASGCPLPDGSGPPSTDDSYRDLVGAAVPEMTAQESWLIVAVTGGRRGPEGPVEVLRREVRLLEGQLRRAEVTPAPPVGVDRLRDLIAAPYRPPRAPGRRLPDSAAWPLAVREDWATLQADGSLHATYWISEWPRVEVGPDFLVPLLTGPGRRAVSLVMAPVPPDRSLREVRSARTADVADAELRSRAGFLPSARREREAEGVERREAELADGHSEYRFSGYVTVSAADLEELAVACADMEHAAQAARLEVRRLYGRQREAFTWTQPFARGLR